MIQPPYAVIRPSQLFPTNLAALRARSHHHSSFGLAKSTKRPLLNVAGSLPKLSRAVVRIHDFGNNAQLCQSCPVCIGTITDYRNFVARLQPYSSKLLSGS